MRASSSKYGSKERKLMIPLYDIGTIVAGFYIGYNEGKGIDTSSTLEYLTKYGPTALAVCMTPIMLKTINAFGKWTNRKTMQNLQYKNFDIIIKDKIIKYKDLNKDQREELTSKMIKNIYNLESKLQNQKYLKPTIITGTRTAIETVIGYTAGRIYSQIN